MAFQHPSENLPAEPDVVTLLFCVPLTLFYLLLILLGC